MVLSAQSMEPGQGERGIGGPDGRLCTKCVTVKPRQSFSRSNIASDGLHTWCKECKSRRTREWYAENADRLRAEAKARYEADPTKKKSRAIVRYHRIKGTATWLTRRNHKLRKYGLSNGDYESMLAKQGGVCAICGEPPNPKRQHDLAVDHCHLTGTVRGLLCHKCNIGLGHFEDSEGLMTKAIDYLKRSRQ